MLKQNLNHTSHCTHHTSNKGITLIALIITIIVMLILVAVTINMAVNGGLFEKAGKATGDTKNAINAEQELSNGRIQIDGTWYDSIDDYLNNNPSANQGSGTTGGETSAIHSWTRAGDTFTCSHCNATYEMGEVVNYTAAGKTGTTITAQMSGLDKYYTANSNSYPTAANVDAKGAQTIEAQSTNWVVLGIEDTDENGTYETLLITTEEEVGVTSDKGLYFYGVAAYNNGPDEINRICEELYSNSEYGKARGMTIEDLNRTLNYTPHGGEYVVNEDSQRNKYTTGNLTTKLKDIPTWDNIKGNHQTPDGTNTEEALGKYELNGYYYYLNDEATGLINDVNDTTTSITEVEKNTIFGASQNYVYWLASRGVCAGSGYAFFGPGFVGYGGACSFGDFFFVSSGSEGYVFRAGLRPVVSLKSKLPTVIPGEE